jgi:hypothetical protein
MMEESNDGVKLMHLIAITQYMREYDIVLDRKYTMADSYQTIYALREKLDNEVKEKKKKRDHDLFITCVKNYVTGINEEDKQGLLSTLETAIRLVKSSRQEASRNVT